MSKDIGAYSAGPVLVACDLAGLEAGLEIRALSRPQFWGVPPPQHGHFRWPEVKGIAQIAGLSTRMRIDDFEDAEDVAAVYAHQYLGCLRRHRLPGTRHRAAFDPRTCLGGVEVAIAQQIILDDGFT